MTISDCARRPPSCSCAHDRELGVIKVQRRLLPSPWSYRSVMTGIAATCAHSSQRSARWRDCHSASGSDVRQRTHGGVPGASPRPR